MEVERFLLAKLVVAGGLGWCLTFTRKSWRSSTPPRRRGRSQRQGGEKRAGSPRYCPRLPVLAGLPPLPRESWLHTLLLVLLGLAALLSQPLLPVVALLTLAYTMIFFDWTRMQPWVHMYGFMLLAIALCDRHEALHIGRLILVSIYFWAGALKANASFVRFVYPWVTGPLRCRLPRPLDRALLALAYAVPPVEAALAVGLLFPETRPVCTVAVVAMHAFILTCFSPHWHKTHHSLWPWNSSMAVTALVLFWNTPAVTASDILWGSPFHLLVFAVFTCLPVLGLFNKLDPNFSHQLMSGRQLFGFLVLNRRLLRNLPAPMQALCTRNDSEGAELYTLELFAWFLAELRVPTPQHEHLLVRIAREVGLRYGATDGDLFLTVYRKPNVVTAEYPKIVYSWADLAPRPAVPSMLGM